MRSRSALTRCAAASAPRHRATEPAITAIMRQSGHACQKSLAQYVRAARAFEDNASGSLGL